MVMRITTLGPHKGVFIKEKLTICRVLDEWDEMNSEFGVVLIHDVQCITELEHHPMILNLKRFIGPSVLDFCWKPHWAHFLILIVIWLGVVEVAGTYSTTYALRCFQNVPILQTYGIKKIL